MKVGSKGGDSKDIVVTCKMKFRRKIVFFKPLTLKKICMMRAGLLLRSAAYCGCMQIIQDYSRGHWARGIGSEDVSEFDSIWPELRENLLSATSQQDTFTEVGCDGENACHVAASANQSNVIRLLLSSLPRLLNSIRNDGSTPLHLSLTACSKESICLLIQEGASLSVPNSAGENAFHFAAKLSNKRATMVFCKMLWQKYHRMKSVEERSSLVSLINAKNKDQRAPLHLAVLRDNILAIQLFLRFKADIEITDSEMLTPLHLTARHGMEESAKLLLRCNANTVAADKGRWTPLHTASFWGHSRIVRLLLYQGASTNMRDSKNKTPLEIASAAGNYVIAKLLSLHAQLSVTWLEEQQEQIRKTKHKLSVRFQGDYKEIESVAKENICPPRGNICPFVKPQNYNKEYIETFSKLYHSVEETFTKKNKEISLLPLIMSSCNSTLTASKKLKQSPANSNNFFIPQLVETHLRYEGKLRAQRNANISPPLFMKNKLLPHYISQ